MSSDLSRARETAEIVGARIGLEVRLDARLREANRGRLGRLYVRGHQAVGTRGSTPPGCAPGPTGASQAGESLQEQQDRVIAALNDIEAAGELPALVVCHGGSIRVVLCSRDPRGLAAFHAFEVPNVAVLRL